MASVTNSNAIALAVTWLTRGIKDAEILYLHDFTIFRFYRLSGRSSRVLIEAKCSLCCSLVTIPTLLEMLWLRCRNAYSSFIIPFIYRPPNSDSLFIYHLNAAVNDVHSKLPNSCIIIFDDFNYPRDNWLNLPTANISSECSVFLSTCLNFNLTHVLLQPTSTTKHSANILDFLLTTKPGNVAPFLHIQCLSDHNIINATLSTPVSVKQVSVNVIRLYEKAF